MSAAPPTPKSLLEITEPPPDEETTKTTMIGIPDSNVIVLVVFLFFSSCLVPLILIQITKGKTPERNTSNAKKVIIEVKKEKGRIQRLKSKKSKKSQSTKKSMKAKIEKKEPINLQRTIRAGEILVERKGPDGTSDDKTTFKQGKEEAMGRRKANMNINENMTIMHTVFRTLFSKMIFKPTMLEVMRTDERDPKKTLIQNWFEFCQPEFEIPDECVAMSLANPSLCVDEKVYAWDETAYLVEDKYFIHASWVEMPGDGVTGKAIICQAPMDGTFPKSKEDTRRHFWKMVEETKAEYIVMACQFVENKKVQCAKYFPEKVDQSMEFGDIKITLTDSREMYDGELVLRKFTYHKIKDEENVKKVTHFQFKKWKQHGIPTGNLALEAVKYVNEIVRRKRYPYICHSSLGTGRACVFTGIEYLCSMICNITNVSTHHFQIHFRRKRMGALETGEQLYFVQNMAFESLIKEFHFYEFNKDMETEWKTLSHYHDKNGPLNKQHMEELETHEAEKYNSRIPFTSDGKKQMIHTVTPQPIISFKLAKTQTWEEKTPVGKSMKKDKKVLKKADVKEKTTKDKTKTKNTTVDKTTITVGDKTVTTTTMNLPTIEGGGAPPPPPKPSKMEKVGKDAKKKKK